MQKNGTKSDIPNILMVNLTMNFAPWYVYGLLVIYLCGV